MKNLLICLVLLAIGGQVSANDLNATFTRTIIVADTISGAVVADTAFSPWMNLRGARYVQFYSELTTNGSGLLPIYTNDTFFVDVQISARKWGPTENVISTIFEIDTFLTVGTSFSPLNLDADATVFGNWIRARLIYLGDAIAADQPDSLGNVRTARLKLWVMPKGGF